MAKNTQIINNLIVSSIDSLYDFMKERHIHNMHDVKICFEDFKRHILNESKKKTRKSSPYNDFIRTKIIELKEQGVGLLENGKHVGKKLMRLAVKAWQDHKQKNVA